MHAGHASKNDTPETTMKLLATLAGLVLGCGLTATAHAQAWPTQPVRIVVAFAAGGAADQLARAVQPALQDALGRPVVVENKVGAGGNVGAAEVAKSPPDGHTLLLGSGGIFSINPHLYRTMPFDPAKDLVPVTSVAVVQQYLVVRADSGINDFNGLIADLRANPGKRSYGTPGVGTSGHLASEMMLADTQTKAIHAPYRGGGPALNDLLGGQLSFMFDSGASLQHVRSGRLRLLGVASPTRASVVPDAPTLDELGLKGFNADTAFGLYAPAGTPPAVINRITAEVHRMLRSGPVRERIVAGGQVPLILTGEQLAQSTAKDFARYGAVIRANAIQAD
jgi:tripartite-type tricarboxylate transporter receptor subunit TctC